MKTATKYAEKIKILSDTMPKEQANVFGRRKYNAWAGLPQLLYGRWLRLYGGVQEAEWRKWFQARILRQLALLDDNDPNNDTGALVSLAVTLFHAGDRPNAAALLAVVYGPLAASKAQAQSASDEQAFAQEHSTVSEGTKEQAQELKLQVENKVRYKCDECEVQDKDAEEM